jgi:hypothetical protein
VGRGTYLGGGTKIMMGRNGTTWGSIDSAEDRSKEKKSRPSRDRLPTKKEIELEEQRELAQESRILRDFISRCASAYATNKLTARYPHPPKIFAKRLASAGGNINWLERNRERQIIFHQAYCKLRRDQTIPFEAVWKIKPGRNSAS